MNNVIPVSPDGKVATRTYELQEVGRRHQILSSATIQVNETTRGTVITATPGGDEEEATVGDYIPRLG